MPKKKKKGKGQQQDVLGTPTSASVSTTATTTTTEAIRTVVIADHLEVRLQVGATTKNAASIRNNKVRLNSTDADQLDVQTGDNVLLIRDSNHIVLLDVEIIQQTRRTLHNITTPGSSSSSPLIKRANNSTVIPAGTVQILSSSIWDCLMQDNGNNEKKETEDKTMTTLVETSSLPLSPQSTPGKFSFKIGGGGDQLYKSPTTANSTTTNKKSDSTKQKHKLLSKDPIWLISCHNKLGQTIIQKLCRPCNKLTLENIKNVSSNTGDNDIPSMTNRIKERLVLSYYAGCYVQKNQTLRISFQGRPVEYRIIQATTDQAVDDLSQAFSEKLKFSDSSESSNIDSVVGHILSNTTMNLFQVQHTTQVELLETAINSKEQNLNANDEDTDRSRLLPKIFVAGLDSTLDEIRSLLLTPLTRPELFIERGLKPPSGILLYGVSGTGKTCIARQIAAELQQTHSCDVEFVNCASLQSKTNIVGQAERMLTELFRTTKNNSKSKLLILDDIHLICPKRGGGGTTDRLAATLLALMDGVTKSSKVVILGTTINPTLLDTALRRPGRLDTEIEIPLPDEVSKRAEIMQFQLLENTAGIPILTSFSNDEWIDLAKTAKGFNGADCMLAVKEAIRVALFENQNDENDHVPIKISFQKFKAAIRKIKPSAIKAVTVEIPKVYWSSIGGMESVKNALREAIELPLSHKDYFQTMGIPPPRGILLYGPPGCSKTLMARALATESQMNFLAVKGPELLSKWLGESERALASLFRRARMASPCIIFFDEIDAIASKRGGGDSASSGRLLSQLLTELDGVCNTGRAQAEKDTRVVVVGATNRPDLLDSALTRPGRIDRMIYVGPPDSASRAQIMKITLKELPYNDDIDFDFLASDEVSQGFSGAEIVAACREAALLVLEESADDDISYNPKIEQQHLVKALQNMHRQITSEVIEFYASYSTSCPYGV